SPNRAAHPRLRFSKSRSTSRIASSVTCRARIALSRTSARRRPPLCVSRKYIAPIPPRNASNAELRRRRREKRFRANDAMALLPLVTITIEHEKRVPFVARANAQLGVTVSTYVPHPPP